MPKWFKNHLRKKGKKKRNKTKQNYSHSTSAFLASTISCSTIRGTTSARVTPPTASISASASQFGVGIPPPVLKPWAPVSDKILAR